MHLFPSIQSSVINIMNNLGKQDQNQDKKNKTPYKIRDNILMVPKIGIEPTTC